uniref:CCD97-like C-terminal domain-containing protein n=1 Tax=Ditylum brightwellii TaxID=49249 RepID=A0A6V2CR80_9STRA
MRTSTIVTILAAAFTRASQCYADTGAEWDYYHSAIAHRDAEYDMERFVTGGAAVEEELRLQGERDAEEAYEQAMMDELDSFLRDEEMMALMGAYQQRQPTCLTV